MEDSCADWGQKRDAGPLHPLGFLLAADAWKQDDANSIRLYLKFPIRESTNVLSESYTGCAFFLSQAYGKNRFKPLIGFSKKVQERIA